MISLRQATSTRKFRLNDFNRRIEAHLTRSLRRGAPGRPRKERADAAQAVGAKR